MKDFIVGVLVIDPERLAVYAKQVGKDADDQTLLEEIKPIVEADLKTLAANN